MHNPPYDTGLDIAPKLPSALKVSSAGGVPMVGPVGSKAVRALIERVQPIASLHGHIHKSRKITKLGRTVCVNPGSQYSEGRLDGVVMEIQDDAVTKCQLVSG